MKVIDAWKSKGKQKQVPRHHSNSDSKRKNTCKHVDLFRIPKFAD